MTCGLHVSVVLIRVGHLVAGDVDLVGSMLHAVLHVLHGILHLYRKLASALTYSQQVPPAQQSGL